MLEEEVVEFLDQLQVELDQVEQVELVVVELVVQLLVVQQEQKI
tara:strand:+ start:269 stop:400 length:132 start_codon:yes stop_codon:yes gene_type:complete